MATSKQYAYYFENGQIGIVEKDVSFDNDVDNKDYGPGASRQRWESPQSTQADSLRIHYSMPQTYRVLNRAYFEVNNYRPDLERKVISSSLITDNKLEDGSAWVLSSQVVVGSSKVTWTALEATNQFIKQENIWPANSMNSKWVKLIYTVSVNANNIALKTGYYGADEIWNHENSRTLASTVGTHEYVFKIRDDNVGNADSFLLYINHATAGHTLEITQIDLFEVDPKGQPTGKLIFGDMDDSSDSGSDFEDYKDKLEIGEYFLLTRAGNYSGLYQVDSFLNDETAEGETGIRRNLIRTTSVVRNHEINSSATSFDFEDNYGQVAQLYYNIATIEDEKYDLGLPNYLQKALIYYVKAKLAEDGGDLKLREYAMREFKKMVEKHETSRFGGPRMISSGSYAIK